MTSDKFLKAELKNTESDLLQIIGAISQIESRIHRISKRMEEDEDLRGCLVFRYDLSGETSNKVYDKIRDFTAQNTPAEFEIKQTDFRNLATIARAIESESPTSRPQYSYEAFNKAVYLAFQLGYMSGWKNKKTDRARKRSSGGKA